MNQRHPIYFASNIERLEFCGRYIYHLKVDGAFELPYTINPIIGEHNLSNCENCQKLVELLKARFTKLFNGNGLNPGFPDCCKFHSNLNTISEFSRELYLETPEMSAYKFIYSYHHFLNNIENDNWYILITNYIEYVAESFGQMPKDCGNPLFLNEYFEYLKHYIQETKDTPKEKRNQIIDFINSYYEIGQEPTADFNKLMGIYSKWFNIFPFELTAYFGNIKQHFSSQLPLFDGYETTNIYSGKRKYRIHTNRSLLDSLIKTTQKLLSDINGVNLYNKGLINDPSNHLLEIVISKRQHKLKIGYGKQAKDDSKAYVKMIKQWLEDEKDFFSELQPILKARKANLNNEEEHDLSSSFINNFDNVPSDEVFLYFKKELVDKKFLSDVDLLRYLRAAFQDQKKPIKRFHFSGGNPKKAITAIFYTYYNEIAGKSHGNQYKYIELLGEYFEGYSTKTLKTNFSKSAY